MAKETHRVGSLDPKQDFPAWIGSHPKQSVNEAMQAGSRAYPAPPFSQTACPARSEANLHPLPLYDAPFYLGSKKLAQKVALITGGDSGIGRAVAILFAGKAPTSRSPT